MRKNFKAELFSYKKIFFGVVGHNIRVLPVPDNQDDLGYTNAKKEIYIKEEHKTMDGLSPDQKKMFRRGVFVHEMLHQVYTNFDYSMMRCKKIPNQFEQQILMMYFNILEDPAIEYFAKNKIGGLSLKALQYSIATIYQKSPDIDASTSAFQQYLNALIQFGDMGLVKGSFTFPQAKKAFHETIELFHQGITEPNNVKRVDIALDIFHQTKYLWEEEVKNQEEFVKMLQELQEFLDKMGKSLEAQGSGEGENAQDTENSTDQKELARRIVIKQTRSNQKSTNSSANSSTDSSDDDEQSSSANGNNQSINENSQTASSTSSEDQAEESDKNSSHKSSKGEGEEEKTGEDSNKSKDENDESTNKAKDEQSDHQSAHQENESKDSEGDQESSKDHSDKSSSENSESSSDHAQESLSKTNDGTTLDMSQSGNSLSQEEVDLLENQVTTEIYEVTHDELAANNLEIFDANKALEKEEEREKKSNINYDIEDFDIQSPAFRNANCCNQLIQLSSSNRESYIDTYQTLVNPLLPGIKTLSNQLKRMFKKDREKIQYKTTGRYNVKRANNGKVSAKIFNKKKGVANRSDFIVGLLVDESGSMGGEKIQAARDTCISFAEVFSKLKIPFYLVGFKGDVGSYDALHEHYITWNHNDLKERAALCRMNASGCNFDSYSIRYAGKLLEKKQAAHKILIVLSDGQPNVTKCNGAEGVNDTKNAIKEVRKNADVIGIAVGNMDASVIHYMYGSDFIHISNVTELYQKIGKLIKKKIEKW